jgi:hypothetical protein
MMSEAAYVKPNGAEAPPMEAEPVDIYPLEPVARRSQSIGALVGALAAAQLTFQPVRKDQDNPYYHSKYADLSTVIAATQPSLAKNGLVVMQESTVDVQRQRVTVTTMLAHSSGEWKERGDGRQRWSDSLRRSKLRCGDHLRAALLLPGNRWSGGGTGRRR